MAWPSEDTVFNTEVERLVRLLQQRTPSDELKNVRFAIDAYGQVEGFTVFQGKTMLFLWRAPPKSARTTGQRIDPSRGQPITKASAKELFIATLKELASDPSSNPRHHSSAVRLAIRDHSRKVCEGPRTQING